MKFFTLCMVSLLLFSGYSKLDLSSRAGNIDITEINIESRGDYMQNSMNTFYIISGDYGWEGGEEYSNEALYHLRHIFRIGTGLQPEVFAQIDYNKQRLLDFRGLIGAGIRYALYTGSGSALRWGSAFMFEHERLDIDEHDNHENETEAIRWSNYLTTGFELADTVTWTSTSYMQPRIDDFGDIRLLCETDLNIGLVRRLSLVVTFRLRYDSEPPEDIKSVDSTLGTGLQFSY